MSDITTIEPNSVPIAPKDNKRVRIPKRLAEGLRLLMTGECKTQKAASERVGMNYTHFCEAIKKPHVRAFYEQKARENIASGAMIASARAIELIHAQSEHVSADMAKHIMAIAGIKPPDDRQLAVNVGVSVGYVINLGDNQAQSAISPIVDGTANPLK